MHVSFSSLSPQGMQFGCYIIILCGEIQVFGNNIMSSEFSFAGEDLVMLLLSLTLQYAIFFKF